MASLVREVLVSEYKRLCTQLIRAGMEPMVVPDVLDLFTDAEIGILINDGALRLAALRRAEEEL